MNNRITINQEVIVPEVYFKSEPQLNSFPRRMEWGGREYTFREGLHYLVHKGQQLVQVFDMTDGAHDYRLKFDTAVRSWTLIDMSA